MLTLLAFALSAFVVLAVAGFLVRLMLAGLVGLALFGALGWLAASPAPSLFPAAWWLLAGWIAVRALRTARRLR